MTDVEQIHKFIRVTCGRFFTLDYIRKDGIRQQKMVKHFNLAGLKYQLDRGVLMFIDVERRDSVNILSCEIENILRMQSGEIKLILGP